MNTNIINLTPHDVVFYFGDNIHQTFPKTGTVARVETLEGFSGDVNGMPVNESMFCGTMDLPAQKDGTVYIVSMVVAQANKNRTDLISPDTFKNCVRDSEGRIVGTKAWVIYR